MRQTKSVEGLTPLEAIALLEELDLPSSVNVRFSAAWDDDRDDYVGVLEWNDGKPYPSQRERPHGELPLAGGKETPGFGSNPLIEDLPDA